MRILYHGLPDGNSGSRVRGLRLLGHEVEQMYFRTPTRLHGILLRAEWRTCNGPFTWNLNREFLAAARRFRPELVWVEMGKLIYPRTLATIKRELGCLMINSYSDDFLDPMKRSRQYNRSIPIYDHIFTPRELNFPEYVRYGARHVHKFWKGFDPELHFPQELTPEELARYGTDVVFVGHCEPSRIEPFARVARVARFKVWGNGWQKFSLPEVLRPCVQFRGAERHEYRRALCGAKIGIQFLSHWARDTQSSRSFEIPACGVFMLADRTQDHQACYEEGKEAEFYSSVDELIDKIRFYLAHDEPRRRIAEAGHRRCLASGYSNLERVRAMLETATGVPQRRLEPSAAELLRLQQV